MLNYKFRLYPTKEQELVLEQTLDGCRWVYNYFLSIPPMSEYDMNYALTELKEQHPWLRNYHSKMLQMVAKQVAAARKVIASMERKPKKKRNNGQSNTSSSSSSQKTGRLSYRNSDDFNAFTYNQTGFKIIEEEKKKNKNDTLSLAKVGRLQIVLHRRPVNVKQVTICRKKDGKWYAIATCQILRRICSTIVYKNPVGIDVGITKFAHDSDNCYVENPQFLTKMLKPVKRAHRRLSRRQVGSSNHRKARHMLAQLYERINNKRRNFLHKTSAYYCSRYDLIFLERLQVSNLTKNHKLARKILDASWYTFREICYYKANRMVEVESAYSSTDCSRCGHRVPKSLAVRTHSCLNCGALLDRDYNSAINHVQNGLQSIGITNMTQIDLPAERGKVIKTPVEPQSEVACDGIDEAGTLHGDMQITGGKVGENARRSLSGKPAPFRTW